MLDALIIGGGPAGAFAGVLLARAGWSVTLVEQHRFPRDKVCGECLSATGIAALQRAGLTEFAVAPVILRRTLIHAGNGSSCEITLPRPMWGISRHILDDHLLNSAKASGVRVLQPARCEGSSPQIIVRDLVTNQIEPIEARHVLRADGKAPSDQLTGDFGIKAHFANVDGPLDAIELFAVDGSYGGLAPIEGNRWNAAFSVPADRLRAHHGNVADLFDEMARENTALRNRLRAAQRIGPWLASPLPRFGVQNDWPDFIIPIGNAAAAMEPIGGEGMGLALRSAELAASALIQAKRLDEPIDLGRLRTDYRRLWKVRRSTCRAVAIAVSHKPMANFVLPAIDGFGTLTGAAMALMGKT